MSILVKDFKTQYANEPHALVHLSWYVTTHVPAIVVTTMDGMPLMKATVNHSGILPPENCVWLKEYAENEGIADALIDGGIIEPEPVTCTADAACRAFRLTEKALADLKATNKAWLS